MRTAFLAEQINRANGLMERLQQIESDLTSAIEDEYRTRQILQELEQELQIKEAELIVTAELDARQKSGPLAGFAKTSAGYKHAVDLLVSRARSNELYDLWQQVQGARTAHQGARMMREKLTIHFSAVKKAVELQVSILNSTQA